MVYSAFIVLTINSSQPKILFSTEYPIRRVILGAEEKDVIGGPQSRTVEEEMVE